MQVVESVDLIALDLRIGNAVEPIEELLDLIAGNGRIEIANRNPVEAVLPVLESCLAESTANLGKSPGNHVRAFRERRGWTQRDLADESGVAVSEIVAIEAGARPRGCADLVADRLNHIAFALEADFDDLFPEAYQQWLVDVLRQRARKRGRKNGAGDLPRTWGWYKEVPLDDAVEVEADSAEVEANGILLAKAVQTAVASLPNIYQKVLACRYFFDMTLDETGSRIGVTREKAQQLEATALRLLRHPYRSRGLRHGL